MTRMHNIPIFISFLILAPPIACFLFRSKFLTFLPTRAALEFLWVGSSRAFARIGILCLFRDFEITRCLSFFDERLSNYPEVEVNLPSRSFFTNYGAPFFPLPTPLRPFLPRLWKFLFFLPAAIAGPPLNF